MEELKKVLIAIVEQDPLSINSIVAVIRAMAISEAQANELTSCLPKYECVGSEYGNTGINLADLESPIDMRMCMMPIKLVGNQIAVL